MALWNEKNLAPPPTNTYKAYRNDLDLTKLRKTLYDGIKHFNHQEFMTRDAAVLSRIIYRMKMKFRSAKDFKTLEKINHALNIYFKTNMRRVVKIFYNVVPFKYSQTTYLPTRNMLAYVLVRLQGIVKLMERLYETCKIAAVQLNTRLCTGNFWKIALISFAIVSRISILVQYNTKFCCELYGKLLPYLNRFENVGGNWLPNGYVLPMDLGEWLGVNWVYEEEYIDLTFRPTSQIPDIFNLVDDKDDDVQFLDEYVQIDEEDKEIVNEFKKLKPVRETFTNTMRGFSLDDDIGEQLDESDHIKFNDRKLSSNNASNRMNLSTDKDREFHFNKDDIGEEISKESLGRQVINLDDSEDIEIVDLEEDTDDQSDQEELYVKSINDLGLSYSDPEDIIEVVEDLGEVISDSNDQEELYVKSAEDTINSCVEQNSENVVEVVKDCEEININHTDEENMLNLKPGKDIGNDNNGGVKKDYNLRKDNERLILNYVSDMNSGLLHDILIYPKSEDNAKQCETMLDDISDEDLKLSETIIEIDDDSIIAIPDTPVKEDIDIKKKISEKTFNVCVKSDTENINNNGSINDDLTKSHRKKSKKKSIDKSTEGHEITQNVNAEKTKITDNYFKKSVEVLISGVNKSESVKKSKKKQKSDTKTQFVESERHLPGLLKQSLKKWDTNNQIEMENFHVSKDFFSTPGTSFDSRSETEKSSNIIVTIIGKKRKSTGNEIDLLRKKLKKKSAGQEQNSTKSDNCKSTANENLEQKAFRKLQDIKGNSNNKDINKTNISKQTYKEKYKSSVMKNFDEKKRKVDGSKKKKSTKCKIQKSDKIQLHNLVEVLDSKSNYCISTSANQKLEQEAFRKSEETEGSFSGNDINKTIVKKKNKKNDDEKKQKGDGSKKKKSKKISPNNKKSDDCISTSANQNWESTAFRKSADIEGSSRSKDVNKTIVSKKIYKEKYESLVKKKNMKNGDQKRQKVDGSKKKNSTKYSPNNEKAEKITAQKNDKINLHNFVPKNIFTNDVETSKSNKKNKKLLDKILVKKTKKKKT